MIIAGCTDGHKGKSHDGTMPNIKQAAARVFDLAVDKPEYALLVIDSLKTEGLPDYEADWLRARVYTSSLEGKWLDSAIVIGERLMQLQVAKENLEYRQDVLEILINTCRQNHDDRRTLKWTAEIVTLCRQNSEDVDAMRWQAEEGVALTHVGREQEGLAKIDSVLSVFTGVSYGIIQRI